MAFLFARLIRPIELVLSPTSDVHTSTGDGRGVRVVVVVVDVVNIVVVFAVVRLRIEEEDPRIVARFRGCTCPR